MNIKCLEKMIRTCRVRIGNLLRRSGVATRIGASNRDVFSDVYFRGLWGKGNEKGDYFSGPGSHCEHMVAPYVDAVQRILGILGGRDMVLVDLGCGDFSIGSALAPCVSRYIGVDVVPDLIRNNQSKHGSSDVVFTCGDIVNEPIPEGDIVTVRQVLQHLSNDDISKLLPKLKQFRVAIITEHIPGISANCRANLDKKSGASIRFGSGSFVDLEEAPFSIKARFVHILLSVNASTKNDDSWGRLETKVFCFDQKLAQPLKSTVIQPAYRGKNSL